MNDSPPRVERPRGNRLISVVVPVYRSRDALRRLGERLSATMEACDAEYELILVDDGSPNGSWDEIFALQQDDPARITAVRLMRNFGQHNWRSCAASAARGATLS